jgi:hypothetical protein
MAKLLKDFAKDYEPMSTTKNIADLPEVSTDIEIEEDSFDCTDKITGKPKTVTQKIITVGKETYRVPVSVVQQLKVLLEDNPNLKKFKVKKTGVGKDDTRYQVIPLG